MRRTLATAITAVAFLFSTFVLAAPAVAADPPPKVLSGTYSGADAERIVRNLVDGAAVSTVACGLGAVVKKLK
ncbi:hypothetical protein [Cryptosporangium minutisporangium]|uniref:Secreted protein n=1 Tax=Cryptosporangium minutisporangium TaxID=113569 RepID=A0ABP6T3E7_9ACTN